MKPRTDSYSQKPLLLVRKVRYPSYQLWAIAGEGNNSETVLKIAVLYTMQWLRERFLEYGDIKELNFPPAVEYEKVDLSDFSNVNIKHGYQLEIIWLPDIKSWSLQLTESDPGIAPREGSLGRLPVAGRIFETNISYQITESGVLCGFQTMVTEPEGTLGFCEVFRLGVIKHLKRDLLIGLRQIWKLEEKPYFIKTKKDVKNFCGRFNRVERTLPLVIVSEHIKQARKLKTQQSDKNAMPEKPIDLLNLNDSSFWNKQYSLLDDIRNNDSVDTAIDCKPSLPIDIETISYNRMGYAHFFIVAADIRNDFNNLTGLELSNGGLIFYPSQQADEIENSYSYEDISAEGFKEKLERMTQQYSSEKQFDFSHCCFVEKAHKIHSEKIFNDINSLSDLKVYYENELARNEDRHGKALAETESSRRSEYRKLEDKLEKEEKRRGAIEAKAILLENKITQYEAEIESYGSRLRGLRSRPSKPSGVCDWVERNFGDKIVILESVRRIMKDIKHNEVDLVMLCDSLEYLASEYWDKRKGLIDEIESNRRCSRNYNRPFSVVPNSTASREYFPDDYLVAYEKNGTIVEEQLTLHLKLGAASEKHVRIYFFIDKEDGRIVIGSMPKHLKIISQR